MNRFLVKICVAVFAILFMSLEIQAVAVQWNMTFIGYEGIAFGDKDIEWMCVIEMPYLNIIQTKTALGLSISAIAESNLENANTFVLANRGDVVSQSYMDSHTSYFAYTKYGDYGIFDGSHADYSIILDGSKSIYLAFAAEYPGLFKGDRYGWVELGVGEDGYIEVLSSAWDLDGDPIMVGAIPEPASGLLVVIGMAFFSLKRRKLQEK